jgi:hypothetical protein
MAASNSCIGPDLTQLSSSDGRFLCSNNFPYHLLGETTCVQAVGPIGFRIGTATDPVNSGSPSVFDASTASAIHSPAFGCQIKRTKRKAQRIPHATWKEKRLCNNSFVDRTDLRPCCPHPQTTLATLFDFPQCPHEAGTEAWYDKQEKVGGVIRDHNDILCSTSGSCVREVGQACGFAPAPHFHGPEGTFVSGALPGTA